MGREAAACDPEARRASRPAIRSGTNKGNAVKINHDGLKMNVGPRLAQAINDGVALAIAEPDGKEDWESAEDWLLQEIAPAVVPAGDADTVMLAAETPD